MSTDLMPNEPTLSRSEASWGDEFRAAFNQAKRHFPDGVITYKAVADRVSQITPTSDTSVLRFGYMDQVPKSRAQRQLAYLALMAMGYDPGEFGLEPRDRALRGMTDLELRKILDPGKIGSNGDDHG